MNVDRPISNQLENTSMNTNNIESFDLASLRKAYIRTLGNTLERKALAQALRSVPNVTNEHLEVSDMDRIVLGEALQEEVRVPHPAAVELYYAVVGAMHRRYSSTGQSDASLLRVMHGLPTADSPNIVHAELLRTGASIGLIGPTGSGKTTLLASIAGLFPSGVRHSNVIPGMEVRQIPMIYIALTGDSTVKNLLLRIIDAIGQHVGVDTHIERLLSGRVSGDRLKFEAKRLCIQFGVGVIIVDETQSMTSSRAGGSELVTNELLLIRDRIGIPLVFAGTFRMMALLASDARMTRRVSQNGLIPISYSADANDKYWDMLCKARWTSLVLRKKGALTPNIVAALYDCTQGMTWALTAILCKAQRRAILTKKETLSAEDILHVFTHDATEMHDLVRAMASRDQGLLARYADLYHPSFDRCRAIQKGNEMDLLRRLGIQPLSTDAASSAPELDQAA